MIPLIQKVINPVSDKIALTTFDGSFSGRDIGILTERYEKLLAPLDIKGKRIGLLVTVIEEYLSLLFAVNKLGGIVIPLSWQFRHEDLTKVLELLDPHIIFSITEHNGFHFSDVIQTWAECSNKKTQIFTSDSCSEWNLTHFIGEEKELDEEGKDFICCSSGSTGTPKGLVFNMKVFDFSYKLISDFQKINSEDNVLFYASTSTIYGIKSMTNIIRAGANVFVPSSFDLPAIIQTMKQANCNKIVTTPSIFKAIYSFAVHLCPQVIANLKLVCLSGERMPENFADQFPDMDHCEFSSQYGISEIGAIGFANLRSGLEHTIYKEIDFTIKNGELLVRTGAVFSAYYRNKELTDSAFENGWYATGDLVELQSDNRSITIVGRKKDMIKKGGQQVIPGEIEAVLSEIEGIKQAVIIGIPHDIYGEQVAAFVVSEGISASEIRSLLKGKISAYKIPDKIISLDAFPMTQGKVDKIKLKSFIA
ncbi:class I adenylate-forming enzyme family protein [Bacillus massiliglaciei]|uniref:class I adenylate-forming enzyme family protein n=1 Tax=Bacillus massiliglaciei TaxID=1816693 RepID=UPI000AFA1036|nr:class I adenylate-forming enzyme family protein [Bacillus massiliglaciei]